MTHSRSRLSPFAPAVGLALGLALACGGLGGGRGDSYSYSERTVAPGADGYPGLDQAYRVPPDRAVLAVTINVAHESFASTASGLTTEVAALEQALGSHCTATVLDYAAPLSSGSPQWTATAEVRVDIDLRGLAGVAERRGRIDACLATIEPLLTPDGWKSLGTGNRQVRRSVPVLAVDAPEQHRDALLARVRTGLAWAAAATGAPQVHPDDLRCVPDGGVTVGDRRLSGVVLTLDMPCRVEAAGAKVGVVAGD
ncbi:MAG: hypothetical protein Q8P18_27710 [Pseudomonadota bacterium]|nr:hypothetical protein [Pseudomonadota bacterium]